MNRAINHGLPRTRGFTLIELMIALVLGLIVIGGVVSVLLSNQQSYRTNQALSQVQDGSRTAFEFLARDIRQAGLTGCSNSITVQNLLANSSTAWWANWANNLHGFDDDVADPAVTSGTAATQRVANTASIQVMGAANSGNSLNTNPTNGGSAFNQTTSAATFNESNALVLPGDVVIACDPNQVAIFQYQPNGAPSITPGNSTTSLGTGFNNNALIAELSAVDWYIGNNSLGTCNAATNPQACSLYRNTLTITGGIASVQPQEIVRNVTGMQLDYLAGLAGGTSFVPAASVTDWSKVTAVRVTLTVNVPTNPNNAANPEFVQRTYTNTIALRNRWVKS